MLAGLETLVDDRWCIIVAEIRANLVSCYIAAL